jgi:hypothetical protein
MREKGHEKWAKPFSTGVVEFKKLKCKDFLKREHTIRDQPMIIREYDEKKDNVKVTANGWESDEMRDKSDHSSPLKRVRRHHSRTPPPYDQDRSRYDSHSSIDSQLRTRSIFLRGPNFPRDPDEEFRRFFSKFGTVVKVSARGPRNRFTFVKFKDYDSAIDAIGNLSNLFDFFFC